MISARRFVSRTSLAVSILANVTFAACGLTDLSYLSNGTVSSNEDAGVDDAGADGDVASGEDGGVEAGDSSSPIDHDADVIDDAGSTDATTDEDAGPTVEDSGSGPVCEVTEYKTPGTAVNVSQPGSNEPWDKPSNALEGGDNKFARASAANKSASQILRVTNFGFALPANADVRGIEVQVARFGGSNPSTYDDAVRLRLDDKSSSGTGRSVAAAWSTTLTSVTYGSATDLWDETISASKVNGAAFGVDFSFQGRTNGIGSEANVDVVRVRIHHCH